MNTSAKEIDDLIAELQLSHKDDRSGNDFYDELVEKLQPWMKSHRDLIVALASRKINGSYGEFWFGLNLAEMLQLSELRQDIVAIRVKAIQANNPISVAMIQSIDRTLASIDQKGSDGVK